nr:hypothetical protein [Tanacetum cinerariifolium]
MSDLEDSIITYTTVSSPYGGLSDTRSPGVDGPPVMPEDPYAYVVTAFQAPPSPDYVPGLEYPPSSEFVLEQVYPEFMPAEDDILPTEEQPLPAVASPTAESPSYIDESDLEDDPKEDPVDYHVDRGDEGDDEDESSDDDEDEDIYIEGDEEEDEYLAPADSTAVALPAIDHAPSAKETVSFETDESAATPPPHPAYRDLYALLEDAHASRTHISQRVVVDSQRVDLLMEDMVVHQETIHIVKDEAYAAREAWAHSIGLSQAVHSELQTHQEQASGTDDKDSLSDGRHETRDEQHAGRVVSTA